MEWVWDTRLQSISTTRDQGLSKTVNVGKQLNGLHTQTTAGHFLKKDKD